MYKISNFRVARVDNLIVLRNTIKLFFEIQIFDEQGVIFLTIYEIFG